jgi:hypothetical protein
MTWQWHTFINDYSTTPGTRVSQDVTLYADWEHTTLKKSASDLVEVTDLFLSFPEDTPDLVIREWMEVWAGFIDTDTGGWVMAQLAGFITKLDGGVNGREHTIRIQVSDYNVLFDKKTLYGWPSAVDDDPIEGFPVDKSIFVWLCNIDPSEAPDGIIPFHYESIEYAATPCVSDIFHSTEIPIESLPGNTSVLGQFQWVSVRKVMEEMVNVTRYILPDTHPMFFFVPKANGDSIIPSFRYLDMTNDSVLPIVTFNSNPTDSTQYPIEQTLSHKRDAGGQITNPVIVGIGGDPTIVGYPLVWAQHSQVEHWQQFWMPYIKSHKLEGAPIIDGRLKTLSMAEAYAQRVETLTWGATGSIEFNCRIKPDNPSDLAIIQLQPGDFVKIIIAQEGQNTVYPIREISIDFSNLEFWLVHLTVGRKQYGLDDIIIGGTADNPIIKGDSGNENTGLHGSVSGFGGGASVAGSPRTMPIVLTPDHSQRNLIKAANKTVVGLVLEQALNIPGQGGIESGGPTDVPIYTQANLIEAAYRDPITRVRTVKAYLDKNFIWRPNFYPFYFPAGFTGPLKETWGFDTTITSYTTGPDEGTPTVTFTKTPLAGGGSSVVTVPFSLKKGDKLQIDVTHDTTTDVTITLCDR